MKQDRRHADETSPVRNALPGFSRTLLWGLVAAATAVAFAVAVAIYWRSAPPHEDDRYADTLPFRPKVAYSGADVTVTNAGGQPYLDTQLTLFVGWTACHARLGTIPPGEKMSIPLRAFMYEDGTRFDPDATKAKLLEVRARMGGYEVHRDLPPPQ